MATHLQQLPTREQLHASIVATAEDIAALLRADAGVSTSTGTGTCTGADPARRIPGAEWTVGAAAAHLALANELMAELAAGVDRAYGDGTPGSLAAANAESLAAFTERAPAPLAESIVLHARAYVAAAAERPQDTPMMTPMGAMDLDTLGSYLLTHMLGHGWDLARALRRPHMIDRQRVDLCLPFLIAAMPRVVDPAAAGRLNARYTLGLRGGPRYTVSFESGVLTVTPGPARRPDCTIVTEPITFFLIALGRCSPWAAIARGKILAWGRRPLLAPAFPTYFRAP